jgi:short-subunit dehydrogenase
MKLDSNSAGKNAVITGASSGLGKAMAEKFKSNGFRVAGICRSRPDIDIDLWLETDITDTFQRQKAFEEIKQEFGSVDLLINNAGRGVYETWENLSEEEIRSVFELNFFALIGMTNLFLPLLKESRGTVINISSVASFLYVPCMGVYCATKSAVSAYSRTLRAELAKSSVKVLNVMPGRISTEFSANALGSKNVPSTPGEEVSSAALAEKVYKSYSKGRRELVFPGWYKFIFPLIKLFPGFYDRKNIEAWKL